MKNLCVNKKQRTALLSLQTEIASLTFLDPACGSGNFLTETYLSLRRLENRIIAVLQGGQAELDLGDVIKVSIGQFYGIEINDFAVTVAKTALWIAESQMMRETEDIVHRSLDFLPLKGYANIVEGNALRMDWMELLAAKNTKGAKCFNYIMGNPPFVGARNKSREQAADMEAVFGKAWNGLGNLDYVTCWYKMAADYVLGTTECTEYTENVRCAFVSTNSICLGEAVALLWKPLFERGIEIDFAWRTFRWDSEAHLKAHVHCVIVGFSAAALRDRTCGTRTTRRTDVCQESSCLSCASYTSQKNPARREARKRIYDGDRVVEAANINGYLMDAPNAWIESRKSAICEVPPLIFGSMPNDGGFLSDWNDEAKNEVVSKYPSAEKFFRRLVGSQEFINNKSRWCLWLKGVSPTEIRSIPPVADAVAKVREMRFASKREGTRKLADVPMLFGEIRQPERGSYLLVPRVSSERREYLPIGFMDVVSVASDAVLIIPSATLYHFGVLTSSVHMAWMRAVAGRLKSDYRYSANIVYNNFPWPEVGESDFNAEAQSRRDSQSCFDRINMIDRIGDIENPVNPVEKDLYVSICSTRTESLRSSATLRLCVENNPVVENITTTAQAILDARALYSDSSLADLYDEATMPPELRKAHQANDRAVMKAYGYAPTMTESEIVADLMRRYQELTK